jgi:hypothetical protein
VNIRLAPIGDFVEPIRTWNPTITPDKTFNYVDLSAVDQIDKLIKFALPVRGSEAPSRARQLISKGDILVSTVRPNLNGVAPVTDAFDGATASTGFCVLRPRSEKLASNYLMHWVRSPKFIDHMVREATGASYPAVSDRIIKASHIPLPPFNEQRRIASILDKADALRRKRTRALDLLDSLTRSMFLEMFGNSKGSGIGKPTSLQEFVDIQVGFPFKSADYTEADDGIRLCRGANILPNRTDWSDLAKWPQELPNDLPAAVKHLEDQELEQLLEAVVAERLRRGMKSPVLEKTPSQQTVDASAFSLNLGTLNAVRAAFKAGVTPSKIAKEFGISQSAVRKVIASEGLKR